LLEGSDAVRAVEPRLTGPLLGALHVPGDLQCDPRAIARALAARAAEKHGAEVRTGAEVAEVVVSGGRAVGVRLTGSEGEVVSAGAVVLAAGPWTRPLAEGVGLELPLEPRKGQLSRFRLERPDEQYLKHKIVDGSYLLSVASGGAGREISTVVETTHDGHLIVGSTRERSGFDAAVDLELEAQVRARAVRPWLPDHLPAIGPSEQVDGLWLATGHEGSGVALGPITGRIIAGALAGEPAPLDLTPFAPDRFAVTSGSSG